MRHRLKSEAPRAYAIIFEAGNELAKGLNVFAAEHDLIAAGFKAIGDLPSVELGWFDWGDEQYRTSVKPDEQIELPSLSGDVALKGGKPAVHAHDVVGKKGATAHGGHHARATARPTCEVMHTQGPAHLTNHIEPESGIALIRP